MPTINKELELLLEKKMLKDAKKKLSSNEKNYKKEV